MPFVALFRFCVVSFVLSGHTFRHSFTQFLWTYNSLSGYFLADFAMFLAVAAEAFYAEALLLQEEQDFRPISYEPCPFLEEFVATSLLPVLTLIGLRLLQAFPLQEPDHSR